MSVSNSVLMESFFVASCPENASAACRAWSGQVPAKGSAIASNGTQLSAARSPLSPSGWRGTSWRGGGPHPHPALNLTDEGAEFRAQRHGRRSHLAQRGHALTGFFPLHGKSNGSVFHRVRKKADLCEGHRRPRREFPWFVLVSRHFAQSSPRPWYGRNSRCLGVLRWPR